MIKKFIAIITVLAVFSIIAVPSTARAATIDELQAQINALIAQLATLQAASTTTGTTTTTTTAIAGVPAGFTFTSNLYLGISNADVKNLQIVLNSDSATQVAVSGVGSAGNETMYFGNLTKAAAIKFQEKYASEVLAPVGLSAGTGFIGSSTRAKLNAILAADTTTGTTTGTTDTTTDTTDTTTVVPTGAGLTVALADSNPASATIVADVTPEDGAQSMIPFVTLKVTNGDSSDVKVTSIAFTRGGISADNDISQAYLMDGLTKLAENQSFTSSVLTFSDSAGLFTVAAGDSREVTLKTDIAGGTTSGKTISFSVATVDAITTDASSISGTFPVAGNVMSTATTGDLGKLTVAAGTDPATTVDPQEDFEVFAFNLTPADQNLNVEKIKVTNIGSTSAGDVENLKLYDGTTLISEVASMASDKTATFDLSGSPLVMTKGQVKNMYVRADLNGGTNRTFQFQIQEMTDIMVKDNQYGVYIKPNQSDAWTIIGASAASTLNTGSLTLTKASNSASGNIAKDGVGVTIAKFDIKATGEDVKIASLITRVYGTVGTDDLDQGAIFFDGAQKGSTTDLNTAATDVVGANTSFTFGNTLVVPAGETKTLEIRANIDKGDGTNYSGDETLTAKILSVSATGKTSSASVSSVSGQGNQLTIKTGTLSAAINNAQPSWSSGVPTGVTGVNEVLIGSFVVTAGASEGANVTAIKLADTSDLFTDVQNVKVYNGTIASGTQIGATKGSVTAGATYTFYPSPYISLNASQQLVVNVYADIKTGVSAGAQGSVDLNQVSGTGKTTNTSVNYTTEVTGQTVFVSAGGSLTVAAASDNPITAQLVAGTTDVELLKAKLTAGAAEDININQFVVTVALGSSAGTSTLSNIKLYNGSTQIGSTLSALSAAGTATFDITSAPLVIIAGSENTVVTVKADTQIYPLSASAGSITASFATTTGIVGKGAVSGSAVTNSSIVSGNAMYTYKTTVTAAASASQPTKPAAPGNADTLMKFDLTNNGNSDAYLNYATFTISYAVGTGNTTTSATRTFNLYDNTNLTNSIGSVTLAANTTINAATVAIDVNADYAIPANSTKTFVLKGDIRDSGLATTSAGSAIKFYINTGTDLNWNDNVSTSVITTNSKTFPVDGPMFSFN